MIFFNICFGKYKNVPDKHIYGNYGVCFKAQHFEISIYDKLKRIISTKEIFKKSLEISETIYNNKEYVKLLTSVGFVVDVYNISARYNKNGLNPLEDLYICKKK